MGGGPFFRFAPTDRSLRPRHPAAYLAYWLHCWGYRARGNPVAGLPLTLADLPAGLQRASTTAPCAVTTMRSWGLFARAALASRTPPLAPHVCMVYALVFECVSAYVYVSESVQCACAVHDVG